MSSTHVSDLFWLSCDKLLHDDSAIQAGCETSKTITLRHEVCMSPMLCRGCLLHSYCGWFRGGGRLCPLVLMCEDLLAGRLCPKQRTRRLTQLPTAGTPPIHPNPQLKPPAPRPQPRARGPDKMRHHHREQQHSLPVPRWWPGAPVGSQQRCHSRKRGDCSTGDRSPTARRTPAALVRVCCHPCVSIASSNRLWLASWRAGVQGIKDFRLRPTLQVWLSVCEAQRQTKTDLQCRPQAAQQICLLVRGQQHV